MDLQDMDLQDMDLQIDTGLDQADEDILTSTVSDEALEAAGSERVATVYSFCVTGRCMEGHC
jgi:hypothetical protein